MQDDLENASRRFRQLESVYETVTVAQLVSTRARTHGSTIAIDIFERGERATYSEMDRRSSQYAHALREFGVGKGDRIGVMLPNRIEFPILWFACAKLGAVLVAINMRYTAREVAYVLGDAQAKFAVVDESVSSVLSAIDTWPQYLAKERVIFVGRPSDGTATTLDKLLKRVDDLPVEEDVRPGDLLNIQYTSGTTGFPKGCMLTHDYWGVQTYQYALIDRQPYKSYLCWSPFSYVLGQLCLLKSYRQGGTLYLAQHLSSTRFVSWLETYRIEWCPFPGPIAETADLVSTCLKEAAQTGGSWSVDTVRRFRERFSVRGQNAYGMTEIGCGTQFPNDFEEMDDSGSVGICSPFRAVRLVCDDGSPAPAGEIGELWIKGRGLFVGYWNKPETNSECFEGEWFKTGDLFRRDDAGLHWIVGRKKDMIRRSGENIAAREVESVIREIPEIADVAAVPVRDAKRGEEVKIYVELHKGLKMADLPVERILGHARARLAPFKVPRYIAFTPALPRTTTSNKVLKRELMETSDPISGAYDTEEEGWR
ncbi:acyl--CoA ligase [Bradyrhizobium huanghuaihaiense]|uniref:class I adenylate-forming enzyme family protein n=1 Tax=Bradyrhizobium huanghuaihaiense TaxID=990078 RepID=UPI0021AA1BBB|nr:class I adenylate-forming enzyme family protein [Bradyrhizobium sp. CB3035]UWU75843.1 acyl--CoA ligase [Bradyrhizobium sp. CB3035]